jgi:hypothetical protein
MKARFTSVGDKFSQPLFFTSQSLHQRVVFLIFSVCDVKATAFFLQISNKTTNHIYAFELEMGLMLLFVKDHSKKQSVNFGTRNSYSPRFQKSTKNKIKLILVFNFTIYVKPSSRNR